MASVKKDKVEQLGLGAVIWIGIFTCACWVINLYYGLSLDVNRRGIFGDMFGAVNALFSGFAFIGVVYAVVLQRKELSISRAEIANSKEIFEQQSFQLQKQNDKTDRQNFESTFFHLVSMLISTAESVYIKRNDLNGPVEIHGANAFDVLKKKLDIAVLPGGAVGRIDEIPELISSVLGDSFGYVERWFMSLEGILRYVDNSGIEGKQFYVDTLMLTMVKSQIFVSFYMGASVVGMDEFRCIARRYNIFSQILHGDDHKEIFDSKYVMN